eukprot:RCo019498
MVTVQEIREELSDAQNARYLDYQIEWWIDHKRHNKHKILKTINNQVTNEERVLAILADEQYHRLITSQLDRRCLNVYHIPAQHRVVVYINSRNKPKHVSAQETRDSVLLFMYYVQYQCESKEGPGAQAEVIVDMLGGAMPTLMELKEQIAMFSGIIGRSFPKICGQLVLCCNWESVFRQAVMALGHAAGLSALVLSPAELLQRYGVEHVPTVVGGRFDLEAMEPVGTLIARWFAHGSNHRTFPSRSLARPAPSPSAPIFRA